MIRCMGMVIEQNVYGYPECHAEKKKRKLDSTAVEYPTKCISNKHITIMADS